MLTVTKEFSFEMAHQLEGYNGKCANIHGHSYCLDVSVQGFPITDPQRPNYGMIIDFTDIKKIVEEEIIAKFDHTLLLRNDTLTYKTLRDIGTHVMGVDYQPTCENILLDFVQRLQSKMPANIKLVHIKLQETATSWAEWHNLIRM